jgi:hypothetical protein
MFVLEMGSLHTVTPTLLKGWHKMETYTQQKKRHHDELGAFDGIFFAFSNEQMKEGIEKHGVNENNKIINIGAGGFVLKSRIQAFKDLLARHEAERKALKQDIKKLFDALVYELRNHEYCITYNAQDALETLGLTKDEVDPVLLKRACHEALEGCYV